MSASPPATLELKHLSGGWGETTVIEDVSLSIAAGDTVAILGRNGVGKTTLLELIVGRARRRAGEVWIAGAELSAAPIHRRAQSGLGYVPQAREVFPSLTVAEHLAIAARPGRWTAERLGTLFPALRARAATLASRLSGGEQQMLAIARALAGNPTLLLMDEPSEGLAPVVIDQLVLALREVVSDDALTVLLVEQRADIALALSRRCLIMERGRVVHDAPSAALAGPGSPLGQLVGFAEGE